MKLADVRFSRQAGAVVAHLTGEIDMSNAQELTEAVFGATGNHALGVVLDLTDVEYLDSAGIHLIYRLGDGLRVRGQRLALVIPSTSPVNDALRLAGVRRDGNVFAALDPALELMRRTDRAGSGERVGGRAGDDDQI